MNIQDILRFFSGAADGQRMTDEPLGPINQVMGGRGVVNPPLANPNAARPQMPRARAVAASTPVQAAMAPTPTASGNGAWLGASEDMAPAAEATPVQAAMAPTPAASGNGAWLGATEDMAPAPAAAAAPQGLLSRFGFSDGNQAMGAIGAALAAAGSPDPAKTALGIQAQRAEEAKLREATRRANQPKFTPLQNGAFVMAEVPGMAPQVLPISQVQNFIQETKRMEMMSDAQKAAFLEKLKFDMKTQFEKDKSDREGQGDRIQAGLSVQELTSIADALDKTDTATGPILGLLPKTLRDIVTPQGASFQDRAERVVQGGLRATLGGQFTQAEGDRFLARAYNPRLPEAQNAANLRAIARELSAVQLDKPRALEYFKQNGTLEGFVPNANPAPAAPAAGGAARPASKADFDALPKGARFIAPDGKEYIK